MDERYSASDIEVIRNFRNIISLEDLIEETRSTIQDVYGPGINLTERALRKEFPGKDDEFPDIIFDVLERDDIDYSGNREGTVELGRRLLASVDGLDRLAVLGFLERRISGTRYDELKAWAEKLPKFTKVETEQTVEKLVTSIVKSLKNAGGNVDLDGRYSADVIREVRAILLVQYEFESTAADTLGRQEQKMTTFSLRPIGKRAEKIEQESVSELVKQILDQAERGTLVTIGGQYPKNVIDLVTKELSRHNWNATHKISNSEQGAKLTTFYLSSFGERREREIESLVNTAVNNLVKKVTTRVAETVTFIGSESDPIPAEVIRRARAKGINLKLYHTVVRENWVLVIDPVSINRQNYGEPIKEGQVTSDRRIEEPIIPKPKSALEDALEVGNVEAIQQAIDTRKLIRFVASLNDPGLMLHWISKFKTLALGDYYDKYITQLKNNIENMRGGDSIMDALNKDLNEIT